MAAEKRSVARMVWSRMSIEYVAAEVNPDANSTAVPAGNKAKLKLYHMPVMLQPHNAV